MRYQISMIIAGILLGTMGVIVKLVGNDIHIVTLNFYRFFFAFIFLVFSLPFLDKNTFNLGKEDVKTNVSIGILFIFSSLTCLTAFVYAPVQNVVLLAAVQPIFVLFLSSFFLREKIPFIAAIVIPISLIGLFIINPFVPGPYVLGNVLAIIAGFFAALQIILMRKVDINHAVGATLWQFIPPTFALAWAPFVFGFGEVRVLPYAIMLGVFAGGLAYIFYNFALEKIMAGTASLTEFVTVPVVSILLAVIVLKESLVYSTIIGGGIILFAGILLQAFQFRKKIISGVSS